MSTNIQLHGHSGCKLHIVSDGKRNLVRKISPTEAYNTRLERQIGKQLSFHHPRIKTPTVLDTGYQDGLFYCEMEYINGLLMYQFLDTCSFPELDKLTDQMTADMAGDAGSDPTRETQRIYLDKIGSLQASVGTESANLEQSFRQLREHKWQFEGSGYFCHGDLTLENIIVTNQGEIYYIDFLDAFAESAAMDQAKILQDTIVHWSYVKNSHPPSFNTRLRLEHLTQRIQRMHGGPLSTGFQEVLHLLLMNLIRIFPYTADPAMTSYLDRALGQVIAQLSPPEDQP
jgi:tRNA A-37 threonylcarbamoyl transferase component Bud32